MSSIIWVLIPLAGILGWIIVEILEYKYKMAKSTDKNSEEFKQVHSEMETLRKRIENLEAIVSEVPEGRNDNTDQSGLAHDDLIGDIKQENREKVHHMAQKKKQKNG